MTYMGSVFNLVLDESKKVLLVHTTRMMNVRIHLSEVIEVTVVIRSE